MSDLGQFSATLLNLDDLDDILRVDGSTKNDVKPTSITQTRSFGGEEGGRRRSNSSNRNVSESPYRR